GPDARDRCVERKGRGQGRGGDVSLPAPCEGFSGRRELCEKTRVSLPSPGQSGDRPGVAGEEGADKGPVTRAQERQGPVQPGKRRASRKDTASLGPSAGRSCQGPGYPASFGGTRPAIVGLARPGLKPPQRRLRPGAVPST